MLWLLILGVVGMVFAPAMWLRPTARERRQGQLRQVAIEAGASVKLDTPPLHGEVDKMAAYRWAYPAQRPGPHFVLVRRARASESLKHFKYDEGWRWRVQPLEPLPSVISARLSRLLSQLPDDAWVVESSDKALTLWWEESLEAPEFGAISAPAAALRDALQGRPDRPAGSVPGSPP
ncbi:preprotein translocase subunit YajC [Halomonas denitrificans]|uniref:preprotein translocase subunit YajC n=1 Tax=Halomonas denitrificans TaxID=370769 RepID=UPI001CD7AA20|nr:preprotein translocase subunit YajC [Halomonas denitrificans]MCA0972869.1 preprotein translocase subunit YajC [Halomonas denitrificans]